MNELETKAKLLEVLTAAEKRIRPLIDDKPDQKWGHFCYSELLCQYLEAISELADPEDVHTQHCCIEHGCKYRDPFCSVEIGIKPMGIDECEQCWMDREDGKDEEEEGKIIKNEKDNYVRASGDNCAYAYWDDDDINDYGKIIAIGPLCGCEKAKAPYGGGAGACGGPCDFWTLRGRKDHRVLPADDSDYGITEDQEAP